MSGTTQVKPDKKKMVTTQQIFHLLLELTELYPKYSIAQHFAGILRRKSNESKEFFFWINEELLKRIEQYKEELEGEDLMNIEEEN
jgi:hypothetical protein